MSSIDLLWRFTKQEKWEAILWREAWNFNEYSALNGWFAHINNPAILKYNWLLNVSNFANIQISVCTVERRRVFYQGRIYSRFSDLNRDIPFPRRESMLPFWRFKTSGVVSNGILDKQNSLQCTSLKNPERNLAHNVHGTY